MGLPPSYDDLPPDVDRLLVLERWHELTLVRIRRALAAAREREAAQQRAASVRPPAPDWVVTTSPGARLPTDVHTGDCFAAPRGRAVTVDEARRALTDGLNACPACRPDTALGFLG
ncbi:DUF6233 domain-containing protein [Streptomyces candidus]|uniref:Uncharacterized protein n=1 Tax=Streptomyces candidus TaxID=67283 RepID=A0A7X0HMJ0_9ACTN|nr:DUF6233 domain-containing protein [Streptomyces candidus]MBB6439117.1 hypothetical protein [Streptomyces candidus]GHH55714.1 hypothetical protein GCM10018773_60600 [Streptomyces candidus]